MSNEQLTPWYPGDVKPVRVGVYQTKNQIDKGAVYQRWNGLFWCLCCDTPDRAATWDDQSLFQRSKWRGLAQPPRRGKA